MNASEHTKRDQLARDIFLQALEIEALAARLAFVDNASQGDPSMRERILALLESNRDDSFLQSPAMGDEVTMPGSEELEEQVGTCIGRYKLLQKIGEGGMGVVYMAEQTEPVSRTVAVKVIKLGMDTKQVVARFEAERQALAMMDHPNIAKVLDAGATESGRPYFVMELVRGVPVTDYCDKNKLSTERRLALFIPVCQAIQHAHQKGVIHRDIKPSNVMVTLHDGSPVPKVIDFGIAKATNRKLTEKTLFTNYAQMIGTPAYMSPEQAEMSGLDVDTRTDIYSLGALLYELMTGTTPFPAKELLNAGYGEMQRIIAEKEPPKLSMRRRTMQNEERTVVASNRSLEVIALGKMFRGDLDWIAMKALEKDRTQRYETVNGLTEDIRRHLNNEPVSAAAPTFAYQLVKLYQRNRSYIRAAAAAMILLTAIATFASYQAVRATREEQLARQALQQAEQAWKREAAAIERASQEQTSADELAEFLIADLNKAIPTLLISGNRETVQLLIKQKEQLAETSLANAPRAEFRLRHTLMKIDAYLTGKLIHSYSYRQAVRLLELIETLEDDELPVPRIEATIDASLVQLIGGNDTERQASIPGLEALLEEASALPAGSRGPAIWGWSVLGRFYLLEKGNIERCRHYLNRARGLLTKKEIAWSPGRTVYQLAWFCTGIADEEAVRELLALAPPFSHRINHYDADRQGKFLDEWCEYLCRRGRYEEALEFLSEWEGQAISVGVPDHYLRFIQTRRGLPLALSEKRREVLETIVPLGLDRKATYYDWHAAIHSVAIVGERDPFLKLFRSGLVRFGGSLDPNHTRTLLLASLCYQQSPDSLEYSAGLFETIASSAIGETISESEKFDSIGHTGLKALLAYRQQDYREAIDLLNQLKARPPSKSERHIQSAKEEQEADHFKHDFVRAMAYAQLNDDEKAREDYLEGMRGFEEWKKNPPDGTTNSISLWYLWWPIFREAETLLKDRGIVDLNTPGI